MHDLTDGVAPKLAKSAASANGPELVQPVITDDEAATRMRLRSKGADPRRIALIANDDGSGQAGLRVDAPGPECNRSKTDKTRSR